MVGTYLRQLFKILLAIVILLVVVTGGILGYYWIQIHQNNGQITSGGQKREYLAYVPKTYQPGNPTPLVISIHGFAEWPAHQKEISRWNELAEEHGFIVVYPAGTGFPPRWSSSGPDSQKEIQFISDLIDEMEARYSIDPARVYANGLSNGGGMSFLLACRLSHRIAAAGGVSGAYLLSWTDCGAARPVPFIGFHGTQDPIVPYEGGPSGSFQIRFPAISDWVKALAKQYGCEETPAEIPDLGDIQGVRYTHCRQEADVAFYTIPGGGHAWPGGPAMPAFIVGYTSQAIDATRLIWDFFLQHPMDTQP